MSAQSAYLTSIFTSFSTFLAERDVVGVTAHEATLALAALIENKTDWHNWDMQRLAGFWQTAIGAQHTTEAQALVTTFVQRYPPTQINVFLHEFCLALKANGCSHSTVKNYRSDISQFGQFAEEHEISELITKPKVLGFLRQQREAGLKHSSIRRKLVSVQQFALWAVAQGLIPQSKWFAELFSALESAKPLEVLDAAVNSPKPAVSVPTRTIAIASVPVTAAHLATRTLENTDLSPMDHQERTAQLQSSLTRVARKHLGNSGQQVGKSTASWALTALVLLVSLIGIGFFGYQQFLLRVSTPFAYPSTPTRPNRQLSFQGRLTDTVQNPITSATDMRFYLYDSGPSTGSGAQLWDSGTCSVTPDQDGIFSVGLGDDCGTEITEDVFSENSNVWLEVEIEAETLDPRQAIQTVPYALNSETLQGYPITASGAATVNTVVTMNSGGEIVLGEVSPTIRSVSGTFSLEAQTLSLETSSGSNGDIILSPDGTGEVQINANTVIDGYLYAPGATLSATYAGGTALVVRGGPTGTANIQEWQNSAGSALTVVDESGNIGINTVNPAYKLDVNGTARLSSTTTIGTNGFIQYNSGRLEFISGSGGQIALYTDSAERLRISTVGNVGINSATPGERLDVVGNFRLTGTTTLNSLTYTWPASQTNGYVLSTNGSGTLSWSDPAVLAGGTNLWDSTNGAIYPKNSTLDLFIGGTATASAKFAFINTNSGVPTATMSAGVNGGLYLTADGSIATTALQTLTLGSSTTGNLSFAPAGAVAATILQNGNVGIGSTNPQQKLDVNSGTTDSVATFRSSDDLARVDVRDNDTAGYLLASNSVFSLGGQNTVHANNVNISTSSGNVGIGVVAASQKLDVVGEIELANYLYFGNAATEYLRWDGSNFLLSDDLLPIADGGQNLGSSSFRWESLFVKGSSLHIGDDGNDAIIGYNTTSNYLSFDPDGDAAAEVVISDAGNVGIGSLTPAVALDVVGDAYISSGLSTFNTAVSDDTIEATTFCTGDGESNCVSDFSILAASSIWTSGNGAIYPKNSTMDLLLGATATTSAKFAFTNVDSGTPTASISAGVAGGTYLNSQGKLATTAMQNLTLGDTSTTGDVIINPSRNVGIGDTSPTQLFTVGNGDLFQINSSGEVVKIDGVAHTVTDSSGDISINSNGGSLLLADTDTLVVGGLAGAAYNAFSDSGTTSHSLASDDDLFVEGDFEVDGTGFFDGAATVTGVLTANGTLDLNGTRLILDADADTSLTTDTDDQIDIEIAGADDFRFTANTFSALSGSTIDVNSGATLDVNGDLAIADTNISLDGTSTTFTQTTGAISFAPAAGTNLNVTLSTTGDFIVNTNDLVVDTSSGNIGIGSTTPGAALDVVGDITLSSGLTTFGTAVSDDTIEATTFCTGDGETNCVSDFSVLSASSIWSSANGAIYPKNSTMDLLLGATATTSAKFAFTNVNSGTPTASISAGVAGGTYLNSQGKLATTAMQNLTLGDSSTTGDVIINPSRNVGIGDTSPTQLFTVGSGDLFQVNSSGEVVKIDGVAHTVTDSSGDLAINSNGGSLLLADTDTLVIGGLAGVAYNAFSDSGTAGLAASDDDVYIEDILEVDGSLYVGAAGIQITNILDEDNMVSNSATALATQQSIKAYVDTTVGAATPNFDEVYAQSITDSNLTMEIDSATGLTFNMDTTGALNIQDNATTYWSFDDDSTVDVTFPAAGQLAIDAAAADSTLTTGVIDLNVDTVTTNNIGLNVDHIIRDSAGITAYGARINQTIDTDASHSSSGYGLYIAADNDDASSTITGLFVDADGDGGGTGTAYAAAFMDGFVGIGSSTPIAPLFIASSAGNSTTGALYTSFVSSYTGGSTQTAGIFNIQGIDSATSGYMALSGNAQTGSSGSFTLSSLTGMQGSVNYQGTAGTLSTATGVNSSVFNSGAGTITNGQAYSANLYIFGSGSTSVATGFRLDTVSDGGAGSFGTLYGMYLTALTAGTSNNYGIWGEAGDWILDEDGDGGAGGTTGGGNIMLGESQDLELYHDGTNSNVTNNTGNLNLVTTGNLAIDAATSVSLDGDTSIILVDGGTTYGTITQSGTTDLQLDIVGGNLILADADTINIGGVGALAYNALSDSGGATSQGLNSDDDLYIEGNLEVDGTSYLDGAATVTGVLTANGTLDLNGTRLILDADADTSITADTDDQIDIEILGADDFRFTTNTFIALTGSTVNVNSGGTLDVNGDLAIADTNVSLDGASTTFTQTTGAISFAPAAGTNLNVTLSTTGDFIVNTNDLVVDTSSGNIGIGSVTPAAALDVVGDIYVTSGLSTFNTAVSDDTIEATRFCVGDGETNCATDFSGITPSGWTDDGATVRLTTAADFVAIGSATNDGKVGIDGARVGQALLMLNEEGDQNIFTASASGTTQAFLTRTGDMTAARFSDFSDSAYYLNPADATTSMLVLGNVGIGSTSPGQKLEVNSGTTDSIAMFRSTDDLGRVVVRDDDTIAYLLASNNLFSIGGQNVLSSSNLNISTADGNVGIGTTASSQKLDVVGEVELSNYLYFGNAATEYLRWNGSDFLLTDDFLPVNAAQAIGSLSAYWGTAYLRDLDINDGSGNAGIIQPLASDMLSFGEFASYDFKDTGLTSFTTLSAPPAAAASGTILNIKPVLNVMNGSDTVSLLAINPTNADHTTGSNFLYGINIGGITADNQTTEVGLLIDSSWDIAAIFNGNVGISDSTPDAKLEVLSTTEQLRLTHTDGVDETNFTVDTDGNLTINNSGTKTMFTDDVQVTGNDILDSGATTRLSLGATTTLTNTTTTLSGTATLTASSLSTFTSSASLLFGSTTTLTMGGSATFNGGGAANDDLAINGTSHATKTTSYVNIQPTGGNVGIGTTTPGAALDIRGPMTTDGSLSFQSLLVNNTTAYNASPVAGQMFYNQYTSGGAYAGMGGITVGKENATDSNYSSYMALHTRVNGSSVAERVRIASDGNVGIGTTGPSRLFHVEGALSSNSMALINNTDTTDNTSNAGLHIRTGATATTTQKRFIVFSASATNVGRIRLNNGNVAYESGGADFAEYFTVNTPNEPGDIIAATNKTAVSGEPIVGVVSDTAAFVGNAKTEAPLANQAIVGFIGQVATKVSAANGSIKKGDPITAGSIPGVGVKATGAGTIVGRALEDFNNSDPNAVQKISVYINPSWFDPTISLDTAGLLEIRGSDSNNYAAVVNGTPITKRTAYAEAVIAKITAGLTTTKNLVVQQSAQIANLSATNITIAGQSLRDFVAGVVRDTIQNEDLVSPLAQVELDERESFTVTNPSGTTVASIDATGKTKLGDLIVTGDASVSGTITSARLTALGELAASSASISGELVANTVTAATISAESVRLATLEGRMAEFESIKAQTADLVNATVSGTLYANNIDGFGSKVAAAFDEPSLLEILLQKTGQSPAATDSATPGNLADLHETISTVGIDASSSAELNLSLADLELTTEDATLTASAAFINDYLKVNGSAYINNSLAVRQNLFVGEGMQIADGLIEYTAAPDEAQILAIQPSGKGTLSLLAGLMELNENGQINITGNLAVAGDVKVEGSLLSNLLQPAEYGNPFQVQVAGIATESGQVKESRFEIVNELGSPVATISAQGRAAFAGGIDIGSESLGATDSETDSVTANKTSGKAKIAADFKEVIIKSELLTGNSLIYVTPVGSTENKVLYVKSQTAENKETGDKEGQFVVGFDEAIGQEVEFNWWVVN